MQGLISFRVCGGGFRRKRDFFRAKNRDGFRIVLSTVCIRTQLKTGYDSSVEFQNTIDCVNFRNTIHSTSFMTWASDGEHYRDIQN